MTAHEGNICFVSRESRCLVLFPENLNVLEVSSVVRSIEKFLCIARLKIAAGYWRLMKKERMSIHMFKKLIVVTACKGVLNVDRLWKGNRIEGVLEWESTRAANDRIPFSITFHPVNNSIKSIVNRNFNLLCLDSSTSNIFSQRSLFSFKKDRNLRTFLVKGTRPSNKESGSFLCSRKRCLTCPFVVLRTTVTGPKSTLNITDHFNL